MKRPNKITIEKTWTKKHCLIPYTKKELSKFQKEGNFHLLRERRLLCLESNTLGEPSVGYAFTIVELKALIKEAESRIKSVRKNSKRKWPKNMMIVTRPNPEMTILLFEKGIN